MADPRLAGITFTGSYDVGMGHLAPDVARAAGRGPASPRWAARTPCIVTARARSGARGARASCARPTASRARSARRCRASTSRSAAADALLAQAGGADRARSGRATRRRRENWMGPVINETAPDSYEEYCVRARAERRRASSPAAGGSTRRRARAAAILRAHARGSAARRTRCGARRCSCRSLMLARVRTRETHGARATTSRSGSPPASTAAPKTCAASSTTSRPASPTPTGRRARPPAPGRATSPSAAGRAPASTGKAHRARPLPAALPARAVADRRGVKPAPERRTSRTPSFPGPRRARSSSATARSSRPPTRATTRS